MTDATSEPSAALEARLDRMVEAGRVTAVEADRVSAATEPGEREAAMHAIRRRHASERVAAAAGAGVLSEAEARDAAARIAEIDDHADLRRFVAEVIGAHRVRPDPTGGAGGG